MKRSVWIYGVRKSGNIFFIFQRYYYVVMHLFNSLVSLKLLIIQKNS